VTRAIRAVALLALAFAAGCTSSAGSPTVGPVNDTSQDTVSTPPSDSPSPPPTTGPSSPEPTGPAPHVTDPGVQALRAWAAAAARTVNAGHYDSAALDKLMTARFRQHMKAVLGNSVGFRYPGPIPFTPKSVHPSANQRQIDVCFVSSGYAVSKKTGKPKGNLQVTPLDARVRRANGRWLVAALYNGSFSCRGVQIRRAT
jgi:hypothetical protein